jgi:DNA-binding FrmR family transcriptional regulator
VPRNVAFSDDPAREERLKTVDSTILEGMRSPTISLNTGERTVLLESDGVVGRQSISPTKSKFSKRRTRARTLSLSLSQAGDRDIDSPGSTHSEQDEVRRAEGDKVATKHAVIVQKLRSKVPRDTPPPPPRARETRATATNRLQGRQGQLEAINKDAEYKNAVDEKIDPRAKHTATTKAGCRCIDPDSVLVKIIKKITANKKLSDPAQVKLINEYYQECHRPGNNHNRLCYNHLQFLASKIGLRTRTAGTKVLRETLDILYAVKNQ